MEETRGEIIPTSKKLDNVQANTLEALRNLGKPLESERVKAALSLLKRIAGTNFTPKVESESEKNEVDYVLERLVRGVGSSRIPARTGFFAALVSLLTLFPSISVKYVVGLVNKELSKGKNVSKSEAADIHMGQVLVYGALIRAGRFIEAAEEDQIEVLNSLLTAGKKRTYLTLVANSFIIQLIKNVKKKKFSKMIWPVIEDSTGIKKDWNDRSLDELHLILAVINCFPSIIPDSSSPLNADNIPDVASLLVNIPNVSYIKHPVYEEYCQQIASTELVSSFWSEIEKQLAKPYRNRQLIALEMLEHIINHLPNKNQIPKFITPVVISLAQKSTSSKKHPQEKDTLDVFVKVKHVFPVMMKNLESEAVKEKTKVQVIKKLLFHPGNFMFERNTGIKVVQPITTALTPKGVKLLADVYQEVVAGKIDLKDDHANSKKVPDYKVIPWKNKERIYAAQLLARLVGAPVMANEHDWKFEQAKFLLDWGIFSKHLGHCDSSDARFVGIELSHALRESFYRCLDHKAGGVQGSIDMLLKLVRYVDGLLKDDTVEDKVLKGMALEDWDKAIEVINKLEKQAEEEKGEIKLKAKLAEEKCFMLLFLQLSLQLFDWDAGLAADALKELNTCYMKLEQERKQKSVQNQAKAMSKKNKFASVMVYEDDTEVKVNGEMDEDEDPSWVEVVVDLFLHLLSQNRHLLRSMICSVFRHLCPRLTPTSLHSILQVLDPRSGKDALTGKNDSDEEDSDSDDKENDDEDKDSNDSDAGKSDEEMSEDELDDDAEEEPTMNEAVRLAVQKALGTAAPTSDTESVDVDEIGEEEGEQLDAALSGAFRLLRDSKGGGKGKKQQSKDERILTHFRVRAVDLIEIYIESEPSMALCCDVMLPLLETLEFCIKDVHQKPLENRLRSCLKKMSNVKFSSYEGMDNTILCDLLNAIIDKGSRTAPIFLDMSNEITLCCKFILRASEHLRRNSEKDQSKKSRRKSKKVESETIIEIYRRSMEVFFTRRDCLLPVSMFRQALHLPWPGCWILTPPLVQFAFDISVRPFRRNQALELLTIFFHNHDLISNPEPIHIEELNGLKREINSHANIFLKSMVNNEDSSNIRKKQLLILTNLLQAIRSSETHLKKIKNEAIKEEPLEVKMEFTCEDIDWDAIGGSLSEIYCGPMKGVGPDGKKAIGKLLKMLELGEVISRHQVKKSLRAQSITSETKEVKNEEEKDMEEDSSKSDNDSGEDENKSSSEDDMETNTSKKDKEKDKRDKKKKRKKASKFGSQKLKKEAKNFRMQEFSKGLEDNCFIGIEQFPEAMNEDKEEEEEVVKQNLIGESKIKKNKKRKSDSVPKKVKKIKTESD